MMRKGLALRRGHILGLAVLVLGGAAVLLSTSDSSAYHLPPECEIDGQHHYEIIGSGTFESTSEESIAAEVEEKHTDSHGRIVLPLHVVGMAGRGYTEGVGETMYWLDKSRPVESMVRAKSAGSEFPAVHDMRFHLFLTTEALPGRTFRSINPAVMVNDHATSFPPKPGARYVLADVVELEDVEDPGVPVIRILSNTARIQASRSNRPILHPNMEPQD